MRNRGAWRKGIGFAFVTLVLAGGWIWRTNDSSGSVAPLSENAGKAEKLSPSVPQKGSSSSDVLTVSLGSAAITSSEPQKEFARVSAEVANSLPTLAALREESRKDPHMTPPVLLNAGAELGRLVRLIQDHPELKRDGALFYRNCSNRDELPSSIRALCFSNLTALSRSLGDGRLLNSASVPMAIRELAEKLPPSFR